MDNPLQNKLLHYTQEPPQRIWDAVASALDEGINPLQDKLHDVEVAPPLTAWDKISSALDEQPQARVVPFYQRFRRPLHYTSAAAIIVLVAVAVTLLIGKRTESESVTAVPGTSHSKLQQALKDAIKLDSDEGATAAHSTTLPQQHNASATTTPGKTPKKQNNKKGLTKYIVVNTEDGDSMRISKKVVPLVACAEANIQCREQIEKLQRRVAATAVSADFTGLLEMLHNLRDNSTNNGPNQN